MSDSSHFVIIANPTAGGGRAGARLAAVEEVLHRGGAQFETRLTSRAGHATTLVRAALREGASGVVALGGDGTLHEATNGFFDEDGAALSPEAWLAPLSAGTGGDFRKTLGHDADPIAGAHRLLTATPRAIDVGWLAYTGNDGRPGECAFLNIASFGLGGVVDRLVNTGPKWLGGRAAFLLAAGRAAASYRAPRVRVRVDDGAPRESKILNVAVANGRFFGGGMQVAPHAELDDGLFDVVFLDEVGFLQSALHTPRIYRGTHLSLPHVSSARGKVVRAEPVDGEDVLLDVDGETPGRLPATFTVKPGALLLRG